MKIVCNKDEFAQLVRSCAISQAPNGTCMGCVFALVCGQNGTASEGDIMGQIEDICEIEPAVMAHG